LRSDPIRKTIWKVKKTKKKSEKNFLSFDNPSHKRRCAEENPAEVMKGLP
jgi:hypothetical protein